MKSNKANVVEIQQRDLRDDFIDLDDQLHTAVHASNSLALALQGLGKIPGEEQEFQLALEWLADQSRFAAFESRKITDRIRAKRAAARLEG